jgi:exodeoxyribonuclease-5
MLTRDQADAKAAIEKWLNSTETRPFLLEGGAGVGKTYLLGEVLKMARRTTVCATPTHKATNVLRRKLDDFGVPWVRGYDPMWWDGVSVITGTTASLLGIAPVIGEDQDEQVRFGKSGAGLLKKMIPSLLVIDEVSMLSLASLVDLCKVAKATGMKILIVGDAAQLPPVRQKAIPFDKIQHRATLREIVRQAKGSAIVEVAWAVRDGRPWSDIEGMGLSRVAKSAAAFLEALEAPGERLEEERAVFISYRNARVNAVCEAACQKLYGHGRLAFAPGELVLSESSLYRDRELIVANQDELIVESFDEAARDPVLGVPVRLRRRGGGLVVTHYLAPEERANDAHPYNRELEARKAEALKYQESFREARGPGRAFVDRQRKDAWKEFFKWRDATLISFRHPFAITSHKSQGSTYRAVFADVPDLARFSPHGLYVAVTRPKDLLVVPA